MKILVIGSEGSLMSWVIPKLLRNGHEIVGCDVAPRRSGLDYQFHQRDMRHAEAVKDVVDDVDIVIQAAAQVYGTLGFHDRGAEILSSDARLQLNVLDAVADRPIRRLVYISSSVVYEGVAGLPLREHDTATAPSPSTGYGLSKHLGERATLIYHQDYGLPYTIWRPFNIITPHERAAPERGLSHVFADFMDAILVRRENPAAIIGDGRQTRCFTWVDDVAEAIASHVDSSATRNEVFNLGSEEQVSMMDLAQRIHRKGVARGILRDDPLEFRHLPAARADIQHRQPDTAKAKHLLGWEAQVSLDECLDRCIEEALRTS